MSITTAPVAASSRPWLTPRRLRAHGMILALCLWALYAWQMSSPGLRDRSGNLKGTDFLHLYTLGSIALAHRGPDLYDMNAQAALVAQRVPEAAGIRYLPLYPPQVSILFAPLARLPYARALAVWLALTTLIYALCAYVLWRCCPNLRGEGWAVFFLAAAFPPFFHLIAWGQTSALALACFTLAFLALRRENKFLAGLALGCLIFKPQLGLAAAIVFVAIGAWRIVGGAFLSAAAQLAVACLYYGIVPLREWLRMLQRIGELLPLLEPRPYQTHSLRTFWNLLVPWPGVSFSLYVVSACVVIALTIAVWQKSSSLPLPLRFSSLLLATVLISPHLTIYDLVILLPVFFLLADWILVQPPAIPAKFLIIESLAVLTPSVSTRRFGDLLYLAYLLPLLGPLDQWTHVQLSVVAMSTLLFVISRVESGAVTAEVLNS